MKTITDSLALDQIFQDLLKLTPGSIKDDISMADISLWDSLHHMELILTIEEKFGIELSFDEISKMQNIGEIRKIVAEKTNK
jgi:acyl carrier protein